MGISIAKKGYITCNNLYTIYWLVVWNIFPHMFVWGSCFWLCTPAFLLSPARHLPHFIQLVHTQLAHTQLAHTPLVITRLTHTHTTCPHTTCHHTTCSHTHNLLTHTLSTHNFSTHNLSPHNLLTHNFSTHNLSPHNLLTHTQLVHTHAHTLRGRGGTWQHRPSLCVAGVALGDIDRHLAWQRGRRGTW